MPPFYGGYDFRHGFGKIHTMKTRKKVLPFSRTVWGIAAFVASCLMPGAVCAASEATSASTFVYVDTAESPFWRTAPSNVVELSIDFPEGASSASLSVTGAYGFSMTTNNLPEGLFTLALPAATSPETEDVYDLTLTFSDGTIREASFGVIAGLTANPEGTARCIVSESSASWSRIHERAVLPIPYGTTSFTIGGETVDTGLGGAAGWYAYGPLALGSSETLGLVASDGNFAAFLKSVGIGTVLIYR